ncbi:MULTISPECIES: lytic murein transglycosylase B [Methylomonas]|uniref:lytic murein transglycosylase B n=1 Tax=Methylomonas TaxID=416 RepID=UPI001232A028|nr:lytic murein transglycosylase B [Methylomonas rhizoryzae]
MKFKTALRAAIASLYSLSTAHAAIPESDAFNKFIAQMVSEHHFNADALKNLFQSVEIQEQILAAMTKPAEAKPWYQYRQIFMTPARIEGGVKFWQDNETTLQAVEQQYGVPAEIIVAIIGVETHYGKNTGKYRVIDALATLGFAYPPRSDFFLKELENFLLLSREENLNPLQPLGSYAGAMGLGQFMPSSYRTYAKDFDQDAKRDIWQNPADAIASVANYFAANKWQPGEQIAFPVSANGEIYKQALSKGVKPDTSINQLRQLKVNLPSGLADNLAGKLLSYQLPDGEELWLGLHNFYVITRYNHSPLYALAVYQLSQEIRQRIGH